VVLFGIWKQLQSTLRWVMNLEVLISRQPVNG
jgi:hypothetical protein